MRHDRDYEILSAQKNKDEGEEKRGEEGEVIDEQLVNHHNIVYKKKPKHIGELINQNQFISKIVLGYETLPKLHSVAKQFISVKDESQS